MLEGVTIEQLRTLRAVASEGSFTAAARKLGRVQAAVSQSVDRLEGQLGLRLFDRSGRTPRLTRHGEAVLAAATKIEDDVQALDALVVSLKRGDETILRVVVDVMFPTTSIVAFARELETEHPGVRLVLFTDVLSGVTDHVRERRSSLGIALEDADTRDLEQRRVADVTLVPVVAPTHALASRPGPLEAPALADAVQIVLGEHHHDAEKGKTQGILSPRRWRVVDLATKHALIAAGLGWGQMPEHLVRADLAAGRLVALDLAAWGASGLRRSLVLVRRGDAVLGPVGRWAERRLAELCRREVDVITPRDGGHHVPRGGRRTKRR